MDYDYLHASDGTGDAALMHITADRAPASTTIDVDSVSDVPAKFIGTSGTVLPSGLIDPATKTDFKGHTSGSTLIIDSFEPGSTDVGNTAGQVVIIKPNTGWANRVADFLVNITGKGTPPIITPSTISDANNNEQITFSTTASAVNQLNIKNAATGTAVVLGTAGGDTNPGLTVTPKGSGPLLLNNLSIPAKFSVSNNSGGTVAATFAQTKIVLAHEIFDSGNNFDSVTNYRFVAPLAGFYYFTASVGFFVVDNILCQSYLYKNGSLAKSGNTVINKLGGNGFFVSTVSGLIQLAASDYVELYGAANSGSTSTVNTGDAITFLDGWLVSQF